MLFDQIARNKQRTVLLLIVFFTLLAGIGAAVGYLMAGSGKIGMILALAIGLIYAVIIIFQSTKVVMSMNGAREISEEEAPDYYHIVEDMAMVAQIPMPRVFIIDDTALNAFATGISPDKAAVAATSGLLAVMTREELEAVMGHEISHIRNYDSRISTIAVALASAISLIAGFGSRSLWYGGVQRERRDRDRGGLELVTLVFALLSIVLAPLAASLVQLAISRQREYLADASSVALTRNPCGMIKALQKLDGSDPLRQPIDDASAALYIHYPKKKELGMQHLFATHPPIAERIARLEKM